MFYIYLVFMLFAFVIGYQVGTLRCSDQRPQEINTYYNDEIKSYEETKYNKNKYEKSPLYVEKSKQTMTSFEPFNKKPDLKDNYKIWIENAKSVDLYYKNKSARVV